MKSISVNFLWKQRIKAKMFVIFESGREERGQLKEMKGLNCESLLKYGNFFSGSKALSQSNSLHNVFNFFHVRLSPEEL